MPRLVPDALVEEVAVVAPPAGVPAALRRRYEGPARPGLALLLRYPRVPPRTGGDDSWTRFARLPPERYHDFGTALSRPALSPGGRPASAPREDDEDASPAGPGGIGGAP